MARKVLPIIYEVDVVDRGTKALLRADRQVRKELGETTRTMRGVDREQTRTATSSTRLAGSQARVGREAAQMAAAMQRSAGAGRQQAAASRSAMQAAAGLARGEDRVLATLRRNQTEARAAATATRQLTAARKQSAQASKTLEKAGSGAGRRVGGAGAIVAAGAGVGAAAGVRSFVDYEAQMTKVRAVAGATEKQMASLDKLALKLGADTKFSAGEAASGMFELATAGFTAAQTAKILPGTLDLAAASGIELAEAAKTQAVALRGFGMQAGDATRVADQMAKAVNTSAIDMNDLSLALPYVAAAAKATGTSFGEVVSMAGLLGNAGISGEKFGTAIRAAMLGLTNPSKQAREALAGIGVDSKELAGIPLPAAIGKIAGKLDGLSRGKRVGIVAQVFGREAAPAVLTLLEQGEKKIQAQTRALADSEGQAKKTAKVMQDNLKSEFEQLGGSVEMAAIKLGKDFDPALRKTTRAATAAVNWLGEHEKTTLALGAAAATAAAGMAGLFVIHKITRWSKSAKEGITALRTGMGWMSRSKAGKNLVDDLVTQTRPMGGRLRKSAQAARAPFVASMGATGRTAGARAAATTAEGVATQLPGSLNSRRGRFLSAGKNLGRVLGKGIGIAAGLAAAYELGKALEDTPLFEPRRWGEKLGGKLAGVLGTDPKPRGARAPAGPMGPPKRRGGYITRFQAGGLVDALVSPGEVIEHGGGAWRVPGARVAGDTVHARLPVGAAVLTDHGQSLRAQGASLAQSIAAQMPHFASGGRVAQIARGAGFRGARLVTSLAVAKAESGWRENAVNRSNSDGSTDRGLWQINSIHGARSTFDPEGNARAAYAISSRGRNWRPWVAYSSGAYRQHLSAARSAALGSRGASGSRESASSGEATAGVPRQRTVSLGPLGRSRTRAGLIDDAFNQGVDLGRSGVTRAALKATGNPVVAATRAALLPTMYQRAVEQTTRSAKAGRSSVMGRNETRAGKYAPGGGWGGSENIVKALIRGIQPTSLKRAANHPLSLSNPGSDHNAANRGAFAADMAAGDGIFNMVARRAGIAARKGAWNIFPNRPVRGYRTQLLWHAPDGSHRDHNHLGVRKLRAGGIIPRYRAGGMAGLSSGLSGTSRNRIVPGRALTTATDAARGNTGGSLEALDEALGRAVSIRIGALRRQIDREVKKGGDRKKVLRLQQVLDTIDGELGRRVGIAERIVEQAGQARERFVAGQDRAARLVGLDTGSSAGIARQRAIEAAGITAMAGQQTTLQRALKNAQRAGSRDKAAELREKLAQMSEEIAEAATRQVEMLRDQIKAAAQERVDAAGFVVDFRAGALAGMDARQRLASVNVSEDTADGQRVKAAQMRERAAQVAAGIGGLENRRAAVLGQAQTLGALGDLAGWRSATLEWQSLGTDITSSMADAAELIRDAAKAERDAAMQLASDLVEGAAFTTRQADYGVDRLELEQKIAGTYDSSGGALARAAAIRDTIDERQGEIDALNAQRVEAERQGNTELLRSIRDALNGKQLDLLGRILAADEATKEATEKTAERMRELGGSLSFEKGGQAFTELISVGIGA